MAARVNVKFIVILLTAIVGIGGIVVVVWYTQYSGAAARQAALGDEFADSGQMYLAMEHYGRALRRDPGNREYLEKYEEALLSIRPETSDSARDLFSNLVSLRNHEAVHNPTNAEAHLKNIRELYSHARLISLVGGPRAQVPFWQRVADAAQNMLDRVPESDPEYVFGRLYRGMATMRLRASATENELRRAESDLEAFVEARPNHDLGWATLILSRYVFAEHYRVAGNSREASRIAQLIPETMERAMEAVPDGPEVARVYLGHLLARRSDGDSSITREAIIEAMDRMIELSRTADDPWLVLDVGETVQAVGGREPAERIVALYEDYIAEHPAALAHRYFLALISYRGIDLDVAEREALQVLEAEPLRVSFLSQMQLTLRRLAAGLLVDIAHERWQRADAADRLALEQNIVDARERLLALVSDPENDNQLIRADAKLAMVRGNYDLAAAKFERLIREGVADVEVYNYAANSLERIQQFGLAYERILTAISARSVTPPILIYHKARLEFRLGRLDEAERTLEEYREMVPDDTQAEQLAAAIESRREQSQDDGGDVVTQALQAAEDAFNEGNIEQARATIESALEQAPSPDPRLYNAAAHIEMSTGETERARAYLEQGLAIAPENPSLKQIQAWLETGDLIAAAPQYISTLTDDEGEQAVFLTTYFAALAAQQKSQAERFERLGQVSDAENARSLARRATERMEQELARARELAPLDRRLFEFEFNRALETRNWEQAEALVAKARQHNLDQTQGMLYEGQYELERGRAEQAVRIFRQATEVKPFSSQAWRGLGVAYERAGNRSEALSAYEQSYRINPNNVRTIRNYLSALVASGERARALGVARDAHRIAPQESQIRDVWLNLEAEAGDVARALIERRRIYEDQPDDRTNATRLALLLAENEPRRELILDAEGEPEYTDRRWGRMRSSEVREIISRERAEWDREIEGIIAGIESRDGMDLQLAVLKATVNRMRGRVAEGIQTLRRYLESIPEDARTAEQWLALAQYLIEAGANEEVLPVIEQAAQYQSPDALEADVALANYQFFRRNYREALPLYERLAEALGNRAMGIRALECLIQVGRYDEAEERLQALRDAGETDYTTVLLEAALLMGQAEQLFEADRASEAARKLEEHRQTLATAERLMPTDPTPHILRAQALLTEYRRTGQRVVLDDALTALGRADAVRPNDPQTSLVRVDVFRAMGNLSRAIGELTRQLERSPNSSQLRRMIVQLYLESGDVLAAKRVLRESIELFPTVALWHRLMGDVHRQNNEMAEAADAYLQAYRLTGSAQLLELVARASVASPSFNPSTLLSLLSERPEHLETNGRLAAIYAGTLALAGRPDDARDWMRQSYQQYAAAINSGEAPPEIIAGWYESVSPMLGRMQPADVEQFLRDFADDDLSAYELLPIARSYRVYGGDGRARARILLEEAVLKAPEDDDRLRSELYNELAMLHLGNQEFAQAAEAYRNVLKFDQNNATVLNNLAFMLAEYLDDPQEALPLAKKAVELSPDSATILDTLGWVQFRSGNAEEAERTLKQSLSAGESAGTYVHLAKVQIELGKHTDAGLALERAAELQPDPSTQAEIDRLTDDIRTSAVPGA